MFSSSVAVNLIVLLVLFHFIFLFFIFWQDIALSHHGHELSILLLQLPKCWVIGPHPSARQASLLLDHLIPIGLLCPLLRPRLSSLSSLSGCERFFQSWSDSLFMFVLQCIQTHVHNCSAVQKVIIADFYSDKLK